MKRISGIIAAVLTAAAVSMSGCRSCSAARERAETTAARTTEVTGMAACEKTADEETEEVSESGKAADQSRMVTEADTAENEGQSRVSASHEGTTDDARESSSCTAASFSAEPDSETWSAEMAADSAEAGIPTAAAGAGETAEAAFTKAASSSEQSAEASEAEHQHSWVPQYSTVHHAAEYETVTVVDQEAYDETAVEQEAWDEALYESHMFCGECGADLNLMPDKGYAHQEETGHMGGYTESVQVGTIHHDAVYTTVHHDAVTHTEQRLTRPAYDEQILSGYRCSSCGAEK